MGRIVTKNSSTAGTAPTGLVKGELAINVVDGKLYYGDGSTTKLLSTSGSGGGTGTVTSVQLTAGTGISLGGTNPITTTGNITITNTAPNQTVTLGSGTGINVTGTYPNFTINNTVNSSIFLTTSSFNSYTSSTTSQFAGTSSFATTASYALNAGTTIDTGSFVTTSSFNAFTQSINTATSSFVTNSQTSSFVTNSQTSSFVQNNQTSSFVLNNQTSSFVLNSQTSSFVTNNQTSSFTTTSSFNTFTQSINTATSSFVTTTSFNAFTSSVVLTSSYNTFTSSVVLTSSTSSMTVLSASYAQTSSYATVAANGGVTKILAGANVNISPVNGLGDVTVTSFGTNLYNTATGSYGSFFDTGSVSATSATAVYSMSLNTTDISNGVFISASNGDNTRIKFTNAGTYNLQFSSQFSNTDNSNQDIVIWIKKNGVDIPDSSGVVTVPPFKAGSNGQVISGWNYFLNLSANDFIQMCWHVEQANVITLETIPAGTSPTHPRTPSTILTANRVDTFLSNTGSFSGSFTGNLIGTASTASYITASNIVGTVLSASYAQTASYALTSAGGSGGISRIISSSITNSITASAAASTDYVYLVSGSVTVTLPTAIGNTNLYTIKRTSTNTVIVAASGSQTIDGSSTISLNVQYQSIDLISDNANWNII